MRRRWFSTLRNPVGGLGVWRGGCSPRIWRALRLATVLVTFALGTAVGDLTALALHVGYLVSRGLFAVVIVVAAILRWSFGLDSVVAF